jgi:hypothetical protein
LNVSVTGNGTVTGQGIDCSNDGGDCTQSYLEGTEVTLTAAPDNGWTFVEWSGDCSGSEPSCDVVMDSDKTVSATFSEDTAPPPLTYTLTVVVEDGGTVTGEGINCGNGNDDCSQEYEEGTEVTLTADADEDWTFAEWDGDCSGSEPTCEVVMDSDKTVTAVFQTEPPSSTIFEATLSGDNEVPTPVETDASGSVTATLDGNALTLEGSYEGMVVAGPGAHIHGPASEDENAGVLFPLEFDNEAGTLSGGPFTLTSAQLQQLQDGLFYVNLHSEEHQDGEIRGQLLP